MILNDEQIALTKQYLSLVCIGFPDCDGDLEGEPHSQSCSAAKRPELPLGLLRFSNFLDTIADLRRQLKEREAYRTAVEIMLSGKSGAAQNVVREDYPQLAEQIDAHDAETRDRALEEARLAYLSHNHEAYVDNKDRCAKCGEDVRAKIHLRVGESTEGRVRALKGSK